MNVILFRPFLFLSLPLNVCKKYFTFFLLLKKHNYNVLGACKKDPSQKDLELNVKYSKLGLCYSKC